MKFFIHKKNKKKLRPRISKNIAPKQMILHLLFISFFFSQTNPVFKSSSVFIDILDSFCYSLFTFLHFDFYLFLRILSSSCLYAFYKKTIKNFDEVQCSFRKVFILNIFLSYFPYYRLTWDCCYPTFIIICYLYMPCKSCAILCMLDAAFLVWLWPQLNLTSIYMPSYLFVKIFWKEI